MIKPKRTPNFSKDLKIGANGELQFQKRFQAALIKQDGKLADFIVSNKVGSGLELKTDTYDSPNFFFERYSDLWKQTDGGAWQAVKHSKYFAYYFITKDVYYLFNLETLIPALEKYIEEKKPRKVEVKNRSYSTGGYVIPINDVKHLAISHTALNALSNIEPEEGFIPNGVELATVPSKT
jgi:hypothetical protein